MKLLRGAKGSRLGWVGGWREQGGRHGQERKLEGGDDPPPVQHSKKGVENSPKQHCPSLLLRVWAPHQAQSYPYPPP